MDNQFIKKVLIIDDELRSDTIGGRALREIIKALKAKDIFIVEAVRGSDGYGIVLTEMGITCILVDWRLEMEDDFNSDPKKLIKDIRQIRPRVPIFIITDKQQIKNLPPDVFEMIQGYLWKVEDTPTFIASRVIAAVDSYLEIMYPPFFSKLKDYVENNKYSWHTPGHSGGMAFRKTPVGEAFYNFYGENTLRSDLSVSVSELDSLLEPKDVILDAEINAAKVFGADHTHFVTNGTSTANKIIFHALLNPGDEVIVDRNCHKSITHGIIMTGAKPVYLWAERNNLNLIGTSSLNEINRILENHNKAKLIVMTNCTYDGLIYNVEKIIEIAKFHNPEINILFDEAWFAHAFFHQLYKDRCAMGANINSRLYATQSTHKLLAAFSQASMIHIKDYKSESDNTGEKWEKTISETVFNEAFMMHSSTSPQYGIIASLDVATAMMENHGKRLINETIEESLIFRMKIQEIYESKKEKGWFKIWGPKVNDDMLNAFAEFGKDESNIAFKEQWILTKEDNWHNFNDNIANDGVILDPTKVTITTENYIIPGTKTPVPAVVVADFLKKRGIQVEKTGDHSLLFLFSIGITKGKSGTLISALLEFSKEFDTSAKGKFNLINKESECAKKISTLFSELYNEQKEKQNHSGYLPQKVYHEAVKGHIQLVNLNDSLKRINALLIVPYPPGIPIIMPGEVITKELIEYLNEIVEFNREFKDHGIEVHGLPMDCVEKKGKREYQYNGNIYVLTDEAETNLN